ncbi:hypothetical protein HHK36_016250 [Tetracentron sinense]|uniref:Uncharacterized protein n=1 Tax=Tetracentron sinense TaxID=13715 RepID=A0A835DE13_TETSI|nr:hypothetical protein HHK36_016250 [Tetracentron sinense]
MTLEPQPHRLSTCNRHPDVHVTGFCASCLRERLSGLEPATGRKSSSSSSTTSALKAIFKGSVGAGDDKNSFRNKASSSFWPELRRSKSFSGGKGEGFSGVIEPQRKSCDVRARNTLWSLFSLDNERKGVNKEVWGEIEVETRDLGFSGVGAPVFESREDNEDETRVSEDVVPNGNVVEEIVGEIIEEEVEEELEQEEQEQEEEEDKVKTMKDHIDLDSQTKKPSGRDLKEIAGSFWLAASVFTKKLQKWRRKQKMKKCGHGGDSAAMQVQKSARRQFRETQSEIADYGFGRRSCDTDPRFSLDAGRISFDDPRYSFDEPRASWDGYLIGKTFPRLPPMLSVVEDVPVLVPRSDNQIPVEEPMNSINEDETTPGGSAQTRDYYSDSSSSHKRRSFDRSSSVRKTAAAVVAEMDEAKSVSNAKVSPATIDYFHGTKSLVTDRDLGDTKSVSLRDDCSESFESAFRDAASVAGGGDKKCPKKSRRWSKAWNIWGLILRRTGSKEEDEEKYYRGNVVERSLSESWPELRREANGEARGAFNRKVFRSNSSVSSRNSYNAGGSFGGIRSTAETNGHGKKRREEFVLERNRSARYSPSHLDNGLLRFYLTPLRSSTRSGSGKSRPKNSNSIAKSEVLRFTPPGSRVGSWISWGSSMHNKTIIPKDYSSRCEQRAQPLCESLNRLTKEILWWNAASTVGRVLKLHSMNIGFLFVGRVLDEIGEDSGCTVLKA